MDTFRRLIFAIAIFLLASIVFSLWRSGQPGYGLLNFLRGQKPGQEEFTAPAAARLDLDDVKILSAMNDEFARLSSAVLPSVVSVTTKTVRRGQTAWHPFFGLVSGRPQVIPGLGSGAIISKEGHVVTNYHVIADVSEIMITTNDNKKYPVSFLGASAERDIALLKIEAGNKKDFPALTFANSDQAKVGQIVFAVGNPFGLSGTVTQGIISARDRHLSDSQYDYLQTDTVINPGNSGGPLVNIRGEIIGVNVAIYRGDENVRAWQGVGLAVPANDAKAVIDAVLKQTKNVSSGYLGLELSAEAVAIDASLGTSRLGAYVTDLDAGSPALAAGITPGDVITALNGKPFGSPRELLAAIRQLAPGSTASLTVFREGQLVDVPVTIGRRPDA